MPGDNRPEPVQKQRFTGFLARASVSSRKNDGDSRQSRSRLGVIRLFIAPQFANETTFERQRAMLPGDGAGLAIARRMLHKRRKHVFHALIRHAD